MKKPPDKIRKILLARTDDYIGDTVLTLPLAGILKFHLPDTQVAFLGYEYNEPIVKKSAFVDEFYDWDKFKDLSKCNADAVMLVSPWFDIAKAVWQAKIPIRIGTARRWFHWFYTNRRVSLKKRAVHLHETQLTTSFLPAIGIKDDFNVDKLYHYYGWRKENKRPFPDVISDTKRNIILHPKSRDSAPRWPLQHYQKCGQRHHVKRDSAPEWPLQHYYELARILGEHNFNVIISGVKEEKDYMQKNCPSLFELPHVTDIVGRYNLTDFINIVEQADCLVASSTGPLHLAAAAGINSIGLYAPVRPQHPGRWKPIGKRVKILCKGQTTNNKKDINKIKTITPDEVKEAVKNMLI